MAYIIGKEIPGDVNCRTDAKNEIQSQMLERNEVEIFCGGTQRSFEGKRESVSVERINT